APRTRRPRPRRAPLPCPCLRRWGVSSRVCPAAPVGPRLRRRWVSRPAYRSHLAYRPLLGHLRSPGPCPSSVHRPRLSRRPPLAPPPPGVFPAAPPPPGPPHPGPAPALGATPPPPPAVARYRPPAAAIPTARPPAGLCARGVADPLTHPGARHGGCVGAARPA